MHETKTSDIYEIQTSAKNQSFSYKCIKILTISISDKTNPCSVSSHNCQHDSACILLLNTVLQRCCCQAPALSINIACLHGTQQQIHNTVLLLSNDGTDRRTNSLPFHRPCSAYYVGSIHRVLISINSW